MERTSGRKPGNLTKVISDIEEGNTEQGHRARMLSSIEGRLQHSWIITCRKWFAASAHVLFFSGHTLCWQMFGSNIAQ